LSLIVGIPAIAQTNSQSPAVLSPAISRNIETIVRDHFNIPPDLDIVLSAPTPSDIPGYNNVTVTVLDSGKVAGTVTMLLSVDQKTMLGVVRFDLSKDPADVTSIVGRPIRGNPQATVKIIVFDDLQCPYCAMMHARLFPDTAMHYLDKVAFIYKDFPLVEIHPWAMHAAVDVNCVAAQSAPQSGAAYWRLVDAIHAQAQDISALATPDSAKSGDVHNAIPQAISDRLDKMTVAEATDSNLNLDALNTCIQLQDQTAIEASVKQSEALGINATPALYVDGERLDGVIDLDLLWNIIDRALLAHGVQPPPRPAPTKPTPASAPAAPAASTPVSPAKP
jgi:protein-disulfide isomerase